MSDAVLLAVATTSALVAIIAAVNNQVGSDLSESRSIALRIRELLTGWRSMWSIQLVRRHRYPFCRVMPLAEAAEVARKQACGTRAAARAACVCDGAKVTEPSYFAALLGDSDTVPLYGFHRASQRVERVSRADFKEAQLVDDGSSLKRYWEGTPIYTQLEIPRCDVHRRIQELVNADD